MSADVLAVVRRDTFDEAARRMIEREVLGALVEPEAGEPSPGIVTARDALKLVAEGRDPTTTPVSDHFTPEATAAAPGWSLERAAETMIEGRFRHLIVAEEGETVGVVSIRDIVRSWTAERAWRRMIQIREAVNRDFLTFDGSEPVQAAARQMVGQATGAAIVERGDRRAPPGIITEREVLAMVAVGDDPNVERVEAHLSDRMTYSAPDWSLKQAAEAMIKGHFQHVVVVDPAGTVGIISMRDVLRRWLD